MADIGLEDELLCPICLELYQDPVSLPCQHNFCRECLDIHLQQHIDTSTGTEFHCPSCRCSFELKNLQVATLPKNVVLANIVGRLQSRKVETTWTEAGLRNGNQSEVCKVHRKPLSVFCDTCDQVICTKCLTDHRGHHTKDLEDKVISCMDEVKRSVLPKITKLKNDLASTQQDLIVRQSCVEEELSNNWQEVMDTFSMLRSVLNRKELELKSNLQTRKEEICSHFKTESQKIDSQLDSLQQFESQVMTVTQQCPASETYLPDFNLYGKIHKDLAQLETELYSPSPVSPRYKGDPHTASSKQYIKDSLLRIAHDLDKMEVSRIARDLDKMEVSRIARDLDKMEVSRIARDLDKMEVSIKGRTDKTLDLLNRHSKSKTTLKTKGKLQHSNPKASSTTEPMKAKTKGSEQSFDATEHCIEAQDFGIPIGKSRLSVEQASKKIQSEFIKKTLRQSLKKHSEVYIVSKSWLGKCQTFLNKKEGVGIHPGPVDNSSIMETDDDLSADLLEGHDFVAVNGFGWSRIVEWYGLQEGQKPIKRKVISEGLRHGALSVEIYPMKVVLVYEGQRSCQNYSKSDSLEFLKQEFLRIFKLSDESDLQLKIKVGGTRTNCWINLSSNSGNCLLRDAGITQGTEIHCNVE